MGICVSGAVHPQAWTFVHDAHDDDHKAIIKRLKGVKENITYVRVYQTSPSHCYVELETRPQRYWIIEKSNEGIVIKIAYGAEDKRRQTTCLKEDTGNSTIKELLQWLHEILELKTPYDEGTSNSFHFAQRVFEKVAKSKTFPLPKMDKDTNKTGGNWTYKIFFAPDVEKSACVFDAADKDLIDRMKALIEVDEPISEVEVYKHTLRGKWFEMGVFYHCFVKFKTDNWHWTIEKDDEGVTIQRSKGRKHVENYKLKEERPTVSQMASDKGNLTVYQVIELLYENDEANNQYHIMTKNCKAFAKYVFDKIAKSRDFSPWFINL